MKPRPWSINEKNEIIRELKKEIKSIAFLVDDLKETVDTDESWETREESKGNVAHYMGATEALERVVKALQGGLSLKELPAMVGEELRSSVDEIRELAEYEGTPEGWLGYIVGALHKFDEDTRVALESVAGYISKALELNGKYALNIDPDVVQIAKKHGSLYR